MLSFNTTDFRHDTHWPLDGLLADLLSGSNACKACTASATSFSLQLSTDEPAMQGKFRSVLKVQGWGLTLAETLYEMQ